MGLPLESELGLLSVNPWDCAASSYTVPEGNSKTVTHSLGVIALHSSHFIPGVVALAPMSHSSHRDCIYSKFCVPAFSWTHF